MKKIAFILLLAGLAVLFQNFSTTSNNIVANTPSSDVLTYQNPLSDFPCGGPSIIYDSAINKFVMACAQGKFPLNTSSNLVQWKRANRNLLPEPLAPWGTEGKSWAPAIAKVGNYYVGYFVQNTSTNAGAIGVSYSTDSLGNYKPRETPFEQMGTAGIIDPSVFIDPQTNKPYMLFKYDGNRINQTTKIYIRELAPNGLYFAPGSEPKLILSGGHNMHDLIEGQELVKRGDYYYLFYSYGCPYKGCQTDYQVRVTRSKNLLGPYIGTRTILETRRGSRFQGPGNGSIIQVNGRHYYFYSAYDRSEPRGESFLRPALIDRIYWIGGWPVINDGYPSENPKPVPLAKRYGHGEVQLDWTAPRLRNPTYSVDVKVDYITISDGRRIQKVIAPCIQRRHLGSATEATLEGECLNEKGDLIPLDRTTSVRVCAAENRALRNSKSQCSEFVPLTSRSIQLEF